MQSPLSEEEQPTWKTRDASVTRLEESYESRGTYKMCIDRATSPSEEVDKTRRSRIARDSEAFSVRINKYVQPRVREQGVQTEDYYLKISNRELEVPNDKFDYFEKPATPTFWCS